jgi:hypothetical protein
VLLPLLLPLLLLLLFDMITAAAAGTCGAQGSAIGLM